MTTEEQNLALVRCIFDQVINKGDFDLMDRFVAADVIEHKEMPGFEPNREGIKQFFSMLRRAFPDLCFHIEDLLGSGDKVVARLLVTGTQKGEFMGIAPTGKQIDMKVIDIFRIADDKVAEHWGISDTMTMMRQLGAIPGK